MSECPELQAALALIGIVIFYLFMIGVTYEYIMVRDPFCGTAPSPYSSAGMTALVWPLYWTMHGGAVVVDALTSTIHPVSCAGVSR